VASIVGSSDYKIEKYTKYKEQKNIQNKIKIKKTVIKAVQIEHTINE